MGRAGTILQGTPGGLGVVFGFAGPPAAARPPMQHDFRSIQGVSDLTSGLPASYLDIVALRIANKSEVKERISDDWRFCASARFVFMGLFFLRVLQRRRSQACPGFKRRVSYRQL